ncbi:MAG: hypothetical protein ABIY55_31300 [Kofleriaceae bacterium]
MENPDPGELFNATFTADVIGVLVEALRAAYETACEHHVPGQGSDEQAFGFNLYKFAVHEHCKTASALNGMEVISRNPSFRLGIGEYELACHRVGSSEREDIWGSFPNNDGAACTMVEEQLWLPGMAQNLSVAKARKLVLAHFGSPDDGFRAAYLCIPGRTEKGRIAAWNFAGPLWIAEQGQFAGDSTQELPPEEDIEAPVVRRKTTTVTDARQAPQANAVPNDSLVANVTASETPAKVDPEKDLSVEVPRKEVGANEQKAGDDKIG